MVLDVLRSSIYIFVRKSTLIRFRELCTGDLRGKIAVNEPGAPPDQAVKSADASEIVLAPQTGIRAIQKYIDI
jgi:hypothetical protein